MKALIYVYAVAVIIMMSGGCRKNKEEEQRYTWSSDAPISIPYRVRQQRFEKINLVRNPSFENGRVFKLDSSTTSFVIDGWQQIGSHVEWADILQDSIYAPDEVYSGTRSVKITRKSALETDQSGEGIISDFIKVIPGNYRLSFYTRLEQVNPGRGRLGTRMYDGVDIRIQYFDRNKIPLNPAYGFPYENQMIDNSLKSLSFANYKNIPSFRWGKVIGKSRHFPFREGDIPTEAHFVKIYIGLKGTGKLWVDSVQFSYTDRNFTVAEKMVPFTDTAFHAPHFVIPTPKKMIREKSIIFDRPDLKNSEVPLIVFPDHPDELTVSAAKLIYDAVESLMTRNTGGRHKPLMLNDISDEQLAQSGLIISIGKSEVYRKFKEGLPENGIKGKVQGYFIDSPADYTHVIIIDGSDDKGVYYGALTAVQLFDKTSPVFHNARIVDYPDFPNRYHTLLEKNNSEPTYSDFINELIRYKINGAFYLQQKPVDGNFQPGINENLYKIVPVAGYLPPDDSTLTYRYPFNYGSNDMSANIGREFLIPAVFHNEMLDNSDFSEMCCQVSSSSKIIYTGSSFFSILTDQADIRRFISIMGSYPVFMDNSMLMATAWGHYGGNDRYYPGKLRLFNLFEPFSNTDVREYFPLFDSSMFVVNLPVNSEIQLIRFATAADFLWNSESYSKDLALWKVLAGRYGDETARSLVVYADKYAVLMETILKIKLNIQAAKNVKYGQQIIVEMTTLVGNISNRLGSQSTLVKELQQLNTELRDRLNMNLTLMPVNK